MSRSGEMTKPVEVRPTVPSAEPAPKVMTQPIFDAREVGVSYGPKLALRDVSLTMHRNEITALIGPSGCGKSTFIRCLNRMNDLIPTAHVEGEVIYHDQDLY